MMVSIKFADYVTLYLISKQILRILPYKKR
jgi:hypothetical protein